jgi:hypothetical protein
MGEDMKIAFITANLGDFEKKTPVFPTQKLGTNDSIDYFSLNDTNFPPRKTLSPRLQAKIPKMLGWQLFPGYDRYVWVDASFMVISEHAVMWLLQEQGSMEIALFKHPDRGSMHEEAQFLRERENDPYIAARYEGEWLKEQELETVTAEECGLYAAGIFIYMPSGRIKAMTCDWWYHVTRYHINDQLSLPYLLKYHKVWVSVIKVNILETGYFKFMR